MTPEEKLCSRWWRIRHSSWLLFSVLSFGTLTGVGFLFVGVKMRNIRLLVLAGIYIAAMIGWSIATNFIDVGTKANPVRSTPATILSVSLVTMWLSGILISALNNRAWLRWRAHAMPKTWYAEQASGEKAAVAPASSVDALSAFDAAVETDLTPSTSVPPASPPQAPTIVDLNQATAPQIMQNLGLDQAWADHLVSTRLRIGGYSSTEQLLTEAKLPPHIFATLQQQVSVSVLPQRAMPRRQLDI